MNAADPVALTSSTLPAQPLQALVDLALTRLPPQVSSVLWRGSQLNNTGHAGATAAVYPTGFAALDAELPGGGWPAQAVTEILQPHDSWLEWRLLLPALQRCVVQQQIRRGRPLVLLGPPWPPHLPGLVQAGLKASDVVWVRTQGQRLLWAAEQVIKAEGAGAVLAWLPQARPEHLRRLQTLAHACAAPVFVLRPSSALADSSAAPLRVLLSLEQVGSTGAASAELRVQIIKRRGPVQAEPLRLTAWPMGLADLVAAPAQLPRGRMPLHADASQPERTPHKADQPAAQRPSRQAQARKDSADVLAVADSWPS